jgi:outer membrane protein TolC
MKIHLSMEDAIQWAVQKNLEVQADNLSVDMARREVVIARATFDPFFNINTTYYRNRDPSVSRIEGASSSIVAVSPSDILSIRSGIRGLSPIGTSYQINVVETRSNYPLRAKSGFQLLNPTWGSRVEFLATQPLLKDAWYAFNTSNIRTARINTEISRKQLELTLVNVVYNVEVAYWEVVFTIKNFAAKEMALQITLEQLRIDQMKVNVGKKAKIDVTTAESLVARRKTEYDRAASLVEDARDKLLSAMNYIGTGETLRGRAEKNGPDVPYQKYGDIVILPTSEPSTDPVTPDRSESIREAFENRVEYTRSDLLMERQDIAISVAKNQLLPALDLTGGWYQAGLAGDFSGSVDSVFSGDFYDWSVGALFEVPLSYRGPRAQYRNARDLRQRLSLEQQNLENSIVLEVDKAIRDLEYYHRAVVNLEKQVALQMEILRAERVKLDVGTSIAYAVAVIENDLVDYLSQLLRAKADFEIAKIAHQKAVGVILKKQAIELGE